MIPPGSLTRRPNSNIITSPQFPSHSHLLSSLRLLFSRRACVRPVSLLDDAVDAQPTGARPSFAGSTSTKTAAAAAALSQSSLESGRRGRENGRTVLSFRSFLRNYRGKEDGRTENPPVCCFLPVSCCFVSRRRGVARRGAHGDQLSRVNRSEEATTISTFINIQHYDNHVLQV